MSSTSVPDTRLQSALGETKAQFPKFHRNYLEAKQWTQADGSPCWALASYADQMWLHAVFFHERHYPCVSFLLLDLAHSARHHALSRQITFDGGVA